MAKRALHVKGEIDAARTLVKSARTVGELRRGLAILLPALTGASMTATAGVLGVSRNQVYVLHRQFRAAAGAPGAPAERRGGRRRQLMSLAEEQAFLAEWLGEGSARGGVPVRLILAAYRERVGRKVAASTIYRMLARHGLQPRRNLPGNGQSASAGKGDFLAGDQLAAEGLPRRYRPRARPRPGELLDALTAAAGQAPRAVRPAMSTALGPGANSIRLNATPEWE